ncbi:unnamed protein product [Phytophthora fragariaefolia]|uniref:ATP-dependent DNA helicase n=1 Tax=Phytophthora fragariaefolia TaxID=1490495 RepID=A0A9W6XKM1_9STRA|nr:unnamed protein product [Phytophthora fragariaefolia]
MYSSHEFVKLPITSVLCALFEQGENIPVVLEGDANLRQFKPSSIWLDYTFRPQALEAVDLMTFATQWIRKKSKKGKKFSEQHPLTESHSMFKSSVKRIATVLHKRLPDIRRQALPARERLRYQRAITVLFRPFRSADDFDTRGTEFNDFFQEWWTNNAPLTARRFVQNNLDYYVSRELLKQQEDPEVARYCSYASANDDDNVGLFGDAMSEDENDDVEGDFLDEEQQNSTNEVVWAPIQPTKHIDALDKSTNCVKLAASSYLNHELPVNGISMTTDDVDAFLKTVDTGESNTTRPVNTYSLLNDYPDVPTRVQLLHRALEGSDEQTASEQIHHRLDIQQQPVTIPDLPSLYQVSLSLGLNEKQQKVFVHVGKKLLRSLLHGHHSDDQIVDFLGGLPGAGKSRVINAVQVLAEKWRSQDSVATAAYQGVAAQAANGQTIHKLFGWNVNSRKRWTPTNEQKERFAKLRLLIIDEVSTCDVSIIGKVDASQRLLLDNPSKLFGGIHVLLVGDWLQQLPVAGQPAFIAASEILHAHNGWDAGSADYLDRVRGINAYRSLNFVVILTENMRHRNDEVWKRILDKWRVGRYDDADIAYVNKIAYNKNWTSDRPDKTSYCPIIVTSNAIRVEFNSSALRAFCRESGAVFHCFPTRVTRPRHHLANIQRKSLTCI